MSKIEHEVINGLRHLKGQAFNITPAKVVSIDEKSLTAHVTASGIDYEDVKLAASGEANTYMIPELGSWVYISFVDGSDNDAYIAFFSKVSKIVLNGGENGGTVLITPVTDRLNAIEKAFNTLLNAFKAHTHGLAPNETAASSGNNLIITKKSDLENINITQ